MGRPIWKGHISFGLVNIPITLYSAESRTDISFQLLDSKDRSHVRYHRINEVTGEEVPWDRIVKGYEYEDNNFIILKDEDLANFKIENQQTIEIEEFVDRCEVDKMYFDKPYYVIPAKGGLKGFVLLRRGLEETGTLAIAKVVIRTKQYLAAMEPSGEALVLTLMRFKQEIRDLADFDFPKTEVKKQALKSQELEMAQQLITSMKHKWEPQKYHDEYREKLMAWLKQRIKKGAGAKVPELKSVPESDTAEVIDVLELLKKSMGRIGKTAAKKNGAGHPTRTAPRTRRAAAGR